MNHNSCLLYTLWSAHDIYFNLLNFLCYYKYLLVLSAPGTTILLLFLGALNRPVASVRCRAENCVGLLSYGSNLSQRLIIVVAWSLLREIPLLSAGTKDTKYEASASTLSKPGISSGPTECYSNRKHISFISLNLCTLLNNKMIAVINLIQFKFFCKLRNYLWGTRRIGVGRDIQICTAGDFTAAINICWKAMFWYNYYDYD